ncbi:MAG: hypothetical protein IKW01_05745, partial [Firmicutes bacterium]|nr:hypothetical protein [Bacillota bacterium]
MKIKRINLVIALLMAISLWVYVLLQVNPFSNELVRNVPITYLNEDTLAKEGLIVLNKEYETVTVSYSGQISY